MNDQYNEQQSHLTSGIRVTEAAIQFLETTRKWSFFLSIVGFVFLGLLVLGGIFIGALFAQIPMAAAFPVNPSIFSVFYFIIAAIHFFPVLYLFKFSTGLKKALDSRDEIALENALESLKSHYKYIGILVSIVLGFYALAILIAIVS